MKRPHEQIFAIETGFEAETGRAMINIRHSTGLDTWITPEMADALANQLISQAAVSTLWQAIAEDSESHGVSKGTFAPFQLRVNKRYKEISEKGEMYFE